ncbi:MAG: maleylpyruvate isomerase family mycothiol-dependent enzyme [Geodermatophilaceae bacterium]
MDRHELTRVVEAERLDLCDFLEDLEASDWLAGSLCPGWTVHDVVAHLTTITMPMSVWDTIKGAISARGDFNRMTADQARRRAAAFQPAALVARLRETAGSSRRAPGSRALDPLVEVLVHGQDIARPLGRSRPMPPDRVIPALAHAVRSFWYGGRRRFEHVKLVATDAARTAGRDSARYEGRRVTCSLLPPDVQPG